MTHQRYDISKRHLFRNVSVLLVLAALVFGNPVRLQAQVSDSTLVVRFQLAESYLRSAQFTRAIPLLEELYRENPQTYVFYERLLESFESVKRYDDAIALVDNRIMSESNQAVYLATKARLLYLKGNDDTARRTWQDAINFGEPSTGVYLLVYRSILQVRLFDFAIDILEEGRTRLKNRSLFRTDLAQLYDLTSRHDMAIREYLALLESNGTQLNYIRTRLGLYVGDSDARSTMISEVERAVADSPLNRSFRELLSWLYMEAGRYRDALTVNRAIDLLEQQRGVVLFSFAQKAAEASALEVAAEAYQEILDRYPDTPSAAEALRGLGIVQEARARRDASGDRGSEKISASESLYRTALNTYREFLNKYVQSPRYPDVLRRIGRLQQDIFFDLPEAMRIFSEVVRRYPESTAADEAAFEIGRIFVMENNLTAARIGFSRLISRLRTGEIADRARLELASLQFYRGQFDSAIAEVTALQENTSTDVANDAIQLKLLLIENRGPDSLDTALRKYSHAALLIRQRKQDDALAELDELLAAFGNHPISDDSRFLRAGVLRRLGRGEESLQAYLELPLIHPSSFLSDRSLLSAGDLQENLFHDTESALKTYTRILTDFPGSLLTTVVRDRIRLLRGDGV